MSGEYIMVMIFGVFTLGGLWYLLWDLKRKHPGQDLGKVLSKQTIKRNEFLTELALIIFFASEAMTASTVFNGEDNHGFPFGRFLMHISISFVGAMSSITLVRDIATMFTKKTHFGYYINNLVLVFILAIISLSVPFFNVMAIASNLDQSFEYFEWWFKITHSEAAYNSFLLKHKLPEDRDVFSMLETTLQVSIGQSIFHVLMAMVLGLRATSSAARIAGIMEVDEEEDDKKKKDHKEKEEKKDEKEEKEDEAAFKDLIGYLLKRVGYVDNLKVKNIQTQAAKKIGNLDPKEQAIIAKNIGQLKLEAIDVDAETDKTKKTNRNNELKKKIKELFNNPPDHKDPDKRGLKIQIGNGGNS